MDQTPHMTTEDEQAKLSAASREEVRKALENPPPNGFKYWDDPNDPRPLSPFADTHPAE